MDSSICKWHCIIAALRYNRIMGKFIDLTTEQFGLWVVLHYHGREDGKTLWWCRCACDTEKAVPAGSLRSGMSTNCGCVRRQKVAARNFVHGMSNTRLYVLYCGMIARCENPAHRGYASYGGRGIRVCKRWRDSFLSFLKDMGNPPSRKHTIDRIGNDGDYEPGNCCWATNKENCRHTRKTRFLKLDDLRLSLAEWAERTGINAITISRRIDLLGWTVRQALTTPPDARFRSRFKHAATEVERQSLSLESETKA